jgi:hypothetical protein
MHCDDIGVVQAGCGSRFPFESSLTIRFRPEGRLQDLDRDLSLQLWIASAKNVAHATAAERPQDLEPPDSISDRETQGRPVP